MTITCKEIEYCKTEVQFVADVKKVIEKRREALELVKQQVKNRPINGFRPGKAPDIAIKIQLKKEIDEVVKQELLSTAYDEYLFETKEKTIGYPQIVNVDLRESNFSCQMIVMNRPKFDLKEYKGFEIPKPHQAMTTTEIAEKMVQELREKQTEHVPFSDTDFVQSGDQIIITYTQSTEGLPDSVVEGAIYVVGSNAVPGIDDNVLGMTAGEERTFNVSLQDKLSTFKLNVHMGMKKILPALDDEFAQKSGFDTYEKMREMAQGIASVRSSQTERQLVIQQIIKRILAQHDFQVPEWLSLMEAQHLVMNAGGNWDQLSDEQRKTFSNQASDNVKWSLIMESIRENEPEAAFSDTELLGILRQKITEAGQDAEKFLVEQQKTGRLIGMLAGLRNEAVQQWLLEQSKIIE